MRYDAEHKARTRSRVLKDAVSAIRAGGPEALGVADVMKRAGLTHGGFYAHFGSREALLVAALEEMFDTAGYGLDGGREDLGPREALKRYVEVYVSSRHRDAREGGCPLPLLSSDLPRLGDPARERFAEGLGRLTSKIAEQLSRLGKADPEAVASSMVSEMIGALSLARAMGATAQSDVILANTRAALFARLAVGDTA